MSGYVTNELKKTLPVAAGVLVAVAVTVLVIGWAVNYDWSTINLGSPSS